MTIEDMIEQLADAAAAESAGDADGEWQPVSTSEAAKNIIAWQEAELRKAELRRGLRDRWYASCCEFDARTEMAQQLVVSVLNGQLWRSKSAWQAGVMECRELLRELAREAEQLKRQRDAARAAGVALAAYDDPSQMLQLPATLKWTKYHVQVVNS